MFWLLIIPSLSSWIKYWDYWYYSYYKISPFFFNEGKGGSKRWRWTSKRLNELSLGWDGQASDFLNDLLLRNLVFIGYLFYVLSLNPRVLDTLLRRMIFDFVSMRNAGYERTNIPNILLMSVVCPSLTCSFTCAPLVLLYVARLN